MLWNSLKPSGPIYGKLINLSAKCGDIDTMLELLEERHQTGVDVPPVRDRASCIEHCSFGENRVGGCAMVGGWYSFHTDTACVLCCVGKSCLSSCFVLCVVVLCFSLFHSSRVRALSFICTQHSIDRSVHQERYLVLPRELVNDYRLGPLESLPQHWKQWQQENESRVRKKRTPRARANRYRGIAKI